MIILRLLALLVLWSTCHSWTLFQLSSQPQFRLAATSDDDDHESLIFSCRERYLSDPIPSATPQHFHNFFQNEQTRLILVSAGYQRNVELVSDISEALRQQWMRQCKQVGAAEPLPDDIMFRTQTGQVHLPGVTVISNVFIGTMLSAICGDYPTLETIMVLDKRVVTGLKPAVWLFKKLTGEDETKPILTDALCRLSVLNTENSTTVFCFDVSAKVSIHFPRLFLRLLPVGKDRAQDIGSAAVKRSLEKDILVALDVLVEKYNDDYAES